MILKWILDSLYTLDPAHKSIHHCVLMIFIQSDFLDTVHDSIELIAHRNTFKTFIWKHSIWFHSDSFYWQVFICNIIIFNIFSDSIKILNVFTWLFQKLVTFYHSILNCFIYFLSSNCIFIFIIGTLWSREINMWLISKLKIFLNLTYLFGLLRNNRSASALLLIKVFLQIEF